MGYLCQSCNSKHPYLKDGFCPFKNIIKKFSPKNFNLEFLGNTPPDIFVGEYNYPNIFTGIISPIEYKEDSSNLSNPEDWFKEKLEIQDILSRRSSMIYSRFKSNIKNKNKLLEVMQEVSMSKKSVDVEFHLDKKPNFNMILDSKAIPMSNPAPLKKAIITENVKIEKPVEKAVYSKDIKSKESILDLYKKGFSISYLVKILSSGLLGIVEQRKLVPTKWSITAVDTLISKDLTEKIKDYQWLNEVLVFHDTYLENHYEIILFPNEWSFEVIEVKLPGLDNNYFWQDYETHEGRKKYAFDVTGAYYANRLGACEYLEQIKKQAGVLIIREIGDYWAPLGVGILREVSRNAFKKQPFKFNTIKEALENMQERLKFNIDKVTNRSVLLKNKRIQRKLIEF